MNINTMRSLYNEHKVCTKLSMAVVVYLEWRMNFSTVLYMARALNVHESVLLYMINQGREMHEMMCDNNTIEVKRK